MAFKKYQSVEKIEPVKKEEVAAALAQTKPDEKPKLVDLET